MQQQKFKKAIGRGDGRFVKVDHARPEVDTALLQYYLQCT
jgi:hypothetical protein